MDRTAWLCGNVLKNASLIVLNQPIKNGLIFARAWDSCSYHVVTDGAANRLRDIPQSEKYVPDLAVGDFDSINPETRAYYKGMNVEFTTDKSVDATDFMKAMKAITVRCPKNEIYLAFGAIGGRVDHSWHSYLCLGRAAKDGKSLILVSDENITFLIPPGAHTVMTPMDVVGDTCGYAPFSGAAHVTTKGFMYDVTDWECSFDTQLSTSNLLVGDSVWIKTDRPLIFTMELRSQFKGSN